MTATTGIRQKILAILADQQPHSAVQIGTQLGEAMSAISMALFTETNKGLVARRSLGRSHVYFCDGTTADAYPAHMLQAALERVAQERRTKEAATLAARGHKHKSLRRKELPAPAGMEPEPLRYTVGPSALKDQSGEYIRTENTREIKAPPVRFDPRYQIDPNTRIVGGFATMGIGRYLTA